MLTKSRFSHFFLTTKKERTLTSRKRVYESLAAAKRVLSQGRLLRWRDTTRKASKVNTSAPHCVSKRILAGMGGARRLHAKPHRLGQQLAQQQQHQARRRGEETFELHGFSSCSSEKRKRIVRAVK